MRSLLYQAPQGLLTRVRRAHSLKDWARKLAVILHKMLITGEPFRRPQPEEVSAEA